MKLTPVYRVVITAVFALALFGQVAAPTALQAAPPAPTTLTPDGILQLPIGETSIQISVLDAPRGFAYFVIQRGSPSNYLLPTLVKIRLADFTRVGSFQLPIGRLRVNSGALDESTGMLYLGTQDGAVHKVDTVQFQYVAALMIAPPFDPTVALLDSTNGYAYFSGDMSGTIVRIRLSDFTLAGTLTLKPGEEDLDSGALDLVHGYAYFVASPRHIVKVRLADFTRVDNLLSSHALYDSVVVVDSTGTYAYFSEDRAGGSMVRVRLEDFTVTDELPIGARYILLPEAGDLAYFIDSYGTTIRLRLPDLTVINQGPLANIGFEISSMLVDKTNGFFYLSSGEQNPAGFAQVAKLQISTLSNAGQLNLEMPERALKSVVYDPSSNIAFYSTCARPYQLIRVNLATLTRVDAMQLPSEYGCVNAGALDRTTGYAYFAMTRGMLKMRLSDFTRIAFLPYFTDLDSVVLDPLRGYAYFGTSNAIPYTPSVIAIQLSTFTEYRALMRDEAQVPGPLTTALVDPQSKYGYFLEQGHVWRVDLKTFLVAGSLTLPNWTWLPDPTGLISPDGSYLYVSGAAGTGQIERVRLADFSLDGSLSLGATVGGVVGSTYDPASGRAYFSTQYGYLFAVDLASFSVADSLALGPNGMTTLVWAAPHGPKPGYLYAGNIGEEARIWRVRVDQVGPPMLLKPVTR